MRLARAHVIHLGGYPNQPLYVGLTSKTSRR